MERFAKVFLVIAAVAALVGLVAAAANTAPAPCPCQQCPGGVCAQPCEIVAPPAIVKQRIVTRSKTVCQGGVCETTVPAAAIMVAPCGPAAKVCAPIKACAPAACESQSYVRRLHIFPFRHHRVREWLGSPERIHIFGHWRHRRGR